MKSEAKKLSAKKLSPVKRKTKPSPDGKKLRLVKFGSDQCQPCRELARRRTLEVFAAKHPEIELVVHNSKVMDDEDDEANKAMDEYEVKSIPAVVFESLSGEVLLESSGGITEKSLEKDLKAALEELEDDDSDEGEEDEDEDDGPPEEDDEPEEDEK